MEKSVIKKHNKSSRGKCLSCFQEKIQIFTLTCDHGFCSIWTIQNMNISKLLYFEHHSASDKFTRWCVCQNSSLIEPETFLLIAKQASIDKEIITKAAEKNAMKKWDSCNFMYNIENITKERIKDKIGNCCTYCKIYALREDNVKSEDQNTEPYKKTITQNEWDIIENINNRVELYKIAEKDNQRQKSLFLQKLDADF